MRIIAGQFKGRVLKGPPASGVRPTSDRLRETLFNVVSLESPECRVLDGFAGTGALGLEAISRGAAHVTFVERDTNALAIVRENVTRCGAGKACNIIRGDFVGIARREPAVGRFDLVLLDPPYDCPDYRLVLAEAAVLVEEGGTVVLEHAKRREAPADTPSLLRFRTIEAGDSHLTFYRSIAGARA
jgi:16S rRNA (guanine966-N2)-methyltransferase